MCKGRPSPGRLRSRLTPYVGCHVCMSVCLSPGLSVICASSKCERKRPGLGDALDYSGDVDNRRVFYVLPFLASYANGTCLIRLSIKKNLTVIPNRYLMEFY